MSKTEDLRQMLGEAVGRYGGKPAIVSGSEKLSYVELDKASNRFANGLLRLGVNKGDRVALLLSNSVEFIIIYFGIVKIGAIVVPLDIKYRASELVSIMGDSQPKVLLAEDAVLEPLVPALSQLKSVEQVIGLGSAYRGRFHTYPELMARSPDSKIDIELGPDDIADIAYTSCASFDPRGSMLSHSGLVQSADASTYGFQQTDRDIMPLFILPLHHMFSQVAVLMASLRKGSTIVIIPGTGLSISTLLSTIEREKGTIFLSIPYIFALKIDMAEKEGIKNDLSSLRMVVSAGAPLPVEVAQRYRELFGFEIFDCWGLTETVCHITCPPIEGNRKLGSVGKALPGWELKIVDDNSRELSTNKSGEILARGPMMKGYYNNPEATAEVIENGWLHTGDAGKLDEDGNLYITGRKKDMIIVKGQNIYPIDVEYTINAHPNVAESVVIGIPDGLRGEIVAAVVSAKRGETVTEQELKKFCLERIAAYKAPKQVFFLKSLPRTADGKIDKKRVREMLAIPPVFPSA